MIQLTDEERTAVEKFVRRGKANARNIRRGQVLLKSVEGWSIERIATTFQVSAATVSNVRKRYRQEGVEGVLTDQRQEKRRSALDGHEQALLVAITGSPVPDGHDHWTLGMLRDKRIELEVVERISPATIHSRLKKMNLNPGGGSMGVSRKR